MKAWNGRVFCRVLYALAGTKKAWLAIKKKLEGYLVILDEWQRKKCRQWGWSKKVLDGVSAIKQAQKDVAALLVGVKERLCEKGVVGRVSLVAMHNCSFDQTDQHVVSLLAEHYCLTNEFREN